MSPIDVTAEAITQQIEASEGRFGISVLSQKQITWLWAQVSQGGPVRPGSESESWEDCTWLIG